MNYLIIDKLTKSAWRAEHQWTIWYSVATGALDITYETLEKPTHHGVEFLPKNWNADAVLMNALP